VKVLISGSFWHGSLEESYARAFESLGWNVIRFDWEEFARAHPLAKMAFADKILRSKIADRVGKWFVATIQDSKPDLVFVVKGKTVGANALEEAKKILGDRLLINFNPDSPWDRANRSQRLLESIPIYDTHFTWNKNLIPVFHSAGGKAVHYLPFGYDPTLHYPTERIATPHYDATFVGTYSEERDQLLGRLKNLNIAIVGNGWERARSVPEKWILSKAVYGKDALTILAQSNSAINILRPQNTGSHNMRTFEIPAAAIPMISTRSEEQLQWFKEGQEAEYYTSAEELSEKIEAIRDDADRARLIAQNAYERVREETYEKRARTMLNILGLKG